MPSPYHCLASRELHTAAPVPSYLAGMKQMHCGCPVVEHRSSSGRASPAYRVPTPSASGTLQPSNSPPRTRALLHRTWLSVR